MLRLGISFVTFGVKDSHVCWLVFLSLKVRDFYVWGKCSYFWGLGIFTFGDYFSYGRGLSILTFGGYGLLRFGVRDFYVWGLLFLRLGISFPTFGG